MENIQQGCLFCLKLKWKRKLDLQFSEIHLILPDGISYWIVSYEECSLLLTTFCKTSTTVNVHFATWWPGMNQQELYSACQKVDLGIQPFYILNAIWLYSTWWFQEMWQFSRILHETRHKLKLDISHAVVEKGLILAYYKALFHTNVLLKLCRTTMLCVSLFCCICRRQNMPSTFCNSFWYGCVFVQARLDIPSVQFCVYPKAISREYLHQEEETSGRHPHQIHKSPKLLPQEQKF